jgi:aldehyde:ferredoxin oxidoreductase
MPYGWIGKLLKVDLTTEKVTTEDTLKYAERFIGGWGIAAKIFFDLVVDLRVHGHNVGAFDKENPLIFMTGPLTGTIAPGSGRTLVCGISPHTHPQEVFAYSSFGGDWGAYLKYAGFDGIIIKGKADRPVYLYIDDGKVDIKDAKDIWNLDTFSTQQMLAKKHGEEVKTACIGPAGVNLVRYAVIVTDTKSTAGQGGFGAVMGSKNLKAITVKGTGEVKVANPQKLLELTKYISALIYRPEKPAGVGEGHDGRLSLVGFQKWSDAYRVRGRGCQACPVNCRGYFKPPGLFGGDAQCIQFSPYGTAIKKKGYMEEEDLDYQMEKGNYMWETNILAQMLGLNCYELFGQIMWLMTCYSLGILSEKETGIPAPEEIYIHPIKRMVQGTATDHEFIDKWLRSIVYRRGFGDKLAEGTARVAETLGKDYWKVYTMFYHAHGMVAHWINSIVDNLLWALDNRDPMSSSHDYGLFAVGNQAAVRFAYGLTGYIPATEDATVEAANAQSYVYAPHIAVAVSNQRAIKNALTLCDWLYPIITSPYTSDGLGDMEAPAKLFSATTGIDLSEEILEKIYGARIVNLFRAIQVMEGRTREKDTVYPNKFEEPMHDVEMFGALPLTPPLDKESFERAKDKYYELRGWDIKTGWPTKETLEKLDLEDVADKLEKMCLLP